MLIHPRHNHRAKLTISNEQDEYKPSIGRGLSALKIDLTVRKILERTGLDTAPDLSALLRILAEPAIEAGAVEAVLDYIDLDQADKPEWAKTVAVWQQPRRPPIPIGVRYHIPEFSCFKLWLSNPHGPLYLADIRTDERLDKSMRKVFLEMRQRAMVIIPLRRAGQWVGLLYFIWDQSHIFSKQERTIYKALMNLVSPLIANCYLLNNLEDKLALLDKVLCEAAERYRELFDISPHGIAYVDLDGHLIECNPAYLDMLGYTSMVEIQRASACRKVQTQLIREKVLGQASNEEYARADLQSARL